jgi:hypothetical protein
LAVTRIPGNGGLLFATPLRAGLDETRPPPEGGDDGLRQLGEVTVVHADGLGVRAGVEHHLRLSHEASIHEHAVSVDGAEGGHGTHFEFGVERGDLVLARQAQRRRAGAQTELLEIHHVVCGEHRLHGLVIGEADDDFGPAPLWDVRHGRLFLRRVSPAVTEAGIRDPLALEEIRDR